MKDLSYKSLKSRVETSAQQIPPQLREFPRIARSLLTKGRMIYLIVASVFVWLLMSSIPASSDNLKKYYCFGPAQSPLEMDMNTYADWHRQAPSEVLFNNHVPLDMRNSSVQAYDLNHIKSTRDAAKNKEKVLILTPLRDSADYLTKYFELLMALTYPHELIDLGFLISDTTDETLAILSTEIHNVQNGPKPFRNVEIFTKDFGVTLDNKDVQQRHAAHAQGPRRKAMGKARNFLLYSALKPDHSWVMWRDVDIVESPASILEDFIRHDTDIIVPNIWFHRYKDGKDIEGRFDYNSWVESDKGRALAKSLPDDVVIAEGYKDIFDTGRKHMARLGHWQYDNHEEMELDGVGGVNIVVKADVHRAGINFPCYSFEHQAETEGFAKMAKRAGYRVVGLPNYVVWHIDTDEKKSKANGNSQS
ncbi:mannan polymerase complexes subunit Mnn9p [Trichomonascus vanleenenianus]|uniref:ANP1/MMN9/VAN1 family protein n=1 Tax=Trichomonascus vanleenenianus TaxID=2268995 RepID=UPI003ECA9094